MTIGQYMYVKLYTLFHWETFDKHVIKVKSKWAFTWSFGLNCIYWQIYCLPKQANIIINQFYVIFFWLSNEIDM